MEQNRIEDLLHTFLQQIPQIQSEQELNDLIEACSAGFQSEAQISRLFHDGAAIGNLILHLRENQSPRSKRLAALTPPEREELAEAELVLTENRFTYHFQPIINAADGSIYAYEALMRPISMLCPKPFHILKYAELTERMEDIERETFINVLQMLDSHPERFSGRKVFLNSIPKVRLPMEDLREIGSLLMKHSDSVVVEMTEQTEADEDMLDAIKERYRNLGIPLAVDDYGTGYSNVKNLLSYMPNYVKIDRSLLTEIQNSPRQRHFVREIIEFCHDNGILALAEGVETAEELQTVIVLGVDLIQGFYTARPAAQVLPALPHAMRQEIRRYRQEREDGKGQQIYFADTTEHIALDRMGSDGIERIIIGKNGSGDVVISGTPAGDTPIHIETVRGYAGSVTLENVRLSNVKNRPCIDIGEDCDVTLCLVGENTLERGGIRVPESAKLLLQGAGKLCIHLDAPEYYGIGNGTGLRHGSLVFDQSGCIIIEAHGQVGVGIGAGCGGALHIMQGQYKLDLNGDQGLAIGSLYTQSELYIHDCDISMDLSCAKGAAIGSLTSDCTVQLRKCSVRLHLTGMEMVGFGTVHGSNAKVELQDASVYISNHAERCSAVAALDGTTNLRTMRVGLRITGGGEQALGIGGFTGDNTIVLITSETNVKLETKLDFRNYITEDQVTIKSGWYHLCLNGVVICSNVEHDEDA